MATKQQSPTVQPHERSEVPFSKLNEIGTYVFKEGGQLLRVPEDALKPGRSPVMDIVGRDVLTVCKLSDDPFIPITKARLVAADLDVEVNF